MLFIGLGKGYLMEKEREAVIRSFLDGHGCHASVSGYNALINAINYACEYPGENCQQIFGRVAENEFKDKLAWRVPYRRARYCFKNSGVEDYKFFEFIKDGAGKLFAEL